MQLSGKSPMTELTPPYCLPHAFRHDRRICEQSSFIGRLVLFFSGVFRNLLSPWLIHFSSDASFPVPVATARSEKRSARRQSPEYEVPFPTGPNRPPDPSWPTSAAERVPISLPLHCFPEGMSIQSS